MNTVNLTGNLTRDPELRHTQSGKTLCRCGIAVNRTKDAVDFFNLLAWDKTAEFISQWFKKGNGIEIVGRLQSSSYEKDGVKHTAVDVVVLSAEFPKSKPQDTESTPHREPQPPRSNTRDDFDGERVDPNDMPF